MIRCGTSTPQTISLAGTAFPAGAKVLVTMPDSTVQHVVTPASVTSTLITFAFVFAVCGTYTFEVTDATGLCDTCPSDPFTITPTEDVCPDEAAYKTLGQLISETAHRLGDDAFAVWTQEEIRQAIIRGYQLVATQLALFWDQVYLENLPRGFSVTQPWELLELERFSGGFNYGVGNFTSEFERRAGSAIHFDERKRYGPANHTSPFEATDGSLSRIHASIDIPATADVPKTLTTLDRVSWDNRGIDALEARSYSRRDARYEITKGEVFGYLWQKDGVRTLRKVRVPATQADTVTVTGSWGALRSTSDLAPSVTPSGTWGIPRVIEGHHPIGPDLFGAPRRVYLEGKNIRVEHFRQGRVLDDDRVLLELPPRYAVYLRDYARGCCYRRPGPGYDKQLGDHFDQRWQRGLARIMARLTLVNTEYTFVMGGGGRPSVTRPPRPQLPWAYGSRVR